MGKKGASSKRQERTQAKLDAWRSGVADTSLVGPQTNGNAPPRRIKDVEVDLYRHMLNTGQEGASYSVYLSEVEMRAKSVIEDTDERIRAWNCIRRVEKYQEVAGEGDDTDKNGVAWELRRLTVPLDEWPIPDNLPPIHYEARYTAESDDWIARIIMQEVSANRVSNAIKWCQSLSPARREKALAWIEAEAHVTINREAV